VTDLAIRGQRSATVEQRRPLFAGDVEHPHAGQIQAVEQPPVRRIGEQDLAMRVQDVPGQRAAAARVVDAAQHVSAQRRRRHGREHLGGVAQQGPDVQRPVGVGDPDEGGRGGAGIRQVLTPRPDAVGVLQRRCVLV
jgi:hypothetical protein